MRPRKIAEKLCGKDKVLEVAKVGKQVRHSFDDTSSDPVVVKR